MTTKNSIKQSNLITKISNLSKCFSLRNNQAHPRLGNIFTVVILGLVLIANVSPGKAMPIKTQILHQNIQQAVSTLSFTAQADAYVEELHPGANKGTLNYLQVQQASNRNTESYIRFTTSGVSGTIQSVELRVYITTSGSNNGPAVYATNNTWTETGITWNNRPALTSGVIDNKGAIARNTWVTYTVTPQVTGNGTYSFALVGDVNDKIGFSSREGSQPPQLLITFNPSTPTPTQTATAIRTATAIQSPTYTRTPTQGGASATPTVTRTNTRKSATN